MWRKRESCQRNNLAAGINAESVSAQQRMVMKEKHQRKWQ
jgi:hypothetical protein